MDENMTNKTPCEVCGKLISTNPVGRKQHMKTHANKSEEVAPVATVEQDLSGIDPALRKEIEAATKIASRRNKEAPDIVAGIMSETSDVLSGTVKRLRVLGILSMADHPFWGVTEKRKSYLSEGYVPVVEDGAQVAYRELQLFKLPRAVHQANERMTARESEDQLASHMAQVSTPADMDGVINTRKLAPPRTAETRKEAD